MRRLTAIALVLLAGFFTAGRLQAQSRVVQATIPFDFIVGNKQMPAGNYRMFEDRGNTLVIQSQNRPLGVLSWINTAEREPFHANPHLTFNKYGDQYFLTEVHCADVEMNGAIPRSKLEKHARALQASVEPEKIFVQGSF